MKCLTLPELGGVFFGERFEPFGISSDTESMIMQIRRPVSKSITQKSDYSWLEQLSPCSYLFTDLLTSSSCVAYDAQLLYSFFYYFIYM